MYTTFRIEESRKDLRYFTGSKTHLVYYHLFQNIKFVVLFQIATLTHLRLLIKTTGPTSLSLTNFTSAAISAFDKLDGIKLKCNNLELESIEALGKSVGFKVAERLWDTA